MKYIPCSMTGQAEARSRTRWVISERSISPSRAAARPEAGTIWAHTVRSGRYSYVVSFSSFSAFFFRYIVILHRRSLAVTAISAAPRH